MRIAALLFMLFSLSACVVSVEEAATYRTGYYETWDRAAAEPVIYRYRRDLPPNWAKTHERVLEAHLGGDYACVDEGWRVLCAPDWSRRWPIDVLIAFTYQGDITRRQVFAKPLYLATSARGFY